ncbi:MAG: hypothetical protein II347_04910 [Lachnospiraceae bacterium]|nr:hypothetical protein [Lachnospiraceae bacterium]
MDGRRPLLCVVGVLAVLVLTVTIMGRIAGTGSGAADENAGDGVLDGRETDSLVEVTTEVPVTEEDEPETTEPVETEPYRIPIGMLYYVKLTEYGQDLPY